MAARLYATGGAPTKRAASLAMGLHENTLTMYSNHNPEVQELIQAVEGDIHSKTLDMAGVLQHLEVKALAVMNKLVDSSTEGIRLKAAQDLLDRGPRTSKIQRSVTAALSINADEAKELAAALLASRNVTEQFKDAVQGDFELVDRLPSNTTPDVTTPAEADRGR